MRQTLILAKNTTEANRYAKLAQMDRFTYRAVTRAGAIRGLRSAEVHVLPSFLVRVDRHAIVSVLRMARNLDVYYVDPVDLVIERLEAGDELEQAWAAAGWVDQARMRLMGGIPQRWMLGVPADCDPEDLKLGQIVAIPNDTEFGTFDETDIATAVTDGELYDGESAAEEDWKAALDAQLEPEDWEPPSELTAEQVLTLAANPDRRGADVLDEMSPVDEDINAKKRRRKRCPVCDQLVWNDDDPAHDAEAHATTEALAAPAPRAVSDFFG